ncbi:hypothetical protein QYE76_005197 [Lolium multiflorum]|uniref:Retrotransposon gag domain-containing protein n=1 Tax=Lolium multiflorum TaxID=4521 RepID=A0AAD8RUF0_LOLMU|nr:hypothetical protein QYE76_005197 [Lolium multiflorum]
MTGAHALQGAAAANGDQAAAVPTGLDLLPATLADLADSLRAIRFELAEIKAGQHPPPRPPFRRAPTAAVAAAPTGRRRRRPHRPPPPPPARVVAAVALADPHVDRRGARLHPYCAADDGPAARPSPWRPWRVCGALRRKHVRQPKPPGGHPRGPAVAQQPPRFTKLEFATYDGATDPLNWLNQCEQFFRGQRTLSTDRTWIASYHLRGAAQTWYYALEQDEGGMPPESASATCASSGLGRPSAAAALPSWDASPSPPRSRTSPTAFRRSRAMPRASRHASAPISSVAALIPRPAPLRRHARHARTPLRPQALCAISALQTATAAEQLERRRQGLCFNCDEKYAPGHTCARLFYLETVDDADVEALTAELAAATVTEAGVTTYAPVDASAFVVSLHAMAGIKTAKTMLLPVTIKGERLTALVDTGSTHNFLSNTAMRRLALQPAGSEKYSVTVANGDRLTCQGVARQVPVLVGDEPFSIDCVGIDLGCYDFILGVDFLSTLGPILWDVDVLSLIFWREGGRRVHWTGVAAPAHPRATPMAAALDEAHPLLAALLQQHGDLRRAAGPPSLATL